MDTHRSRIYTDRDSDPMLLCSAASRQNPGPGMVFAWSLHGHAHRLDGSTLSLRLTAYDWPSSRKTPFDLARYSVPGYMAPLRDLPPEGMPGSTCGFKGGSYLLSIASTKSW